VPSTPATRDQVEQIFESVDVEGIAESVAANLSKLQTLLSSDELASALGGLDRTLREAGLLLAKVNAGLDPMLDNANDTLIAYEELAETLEGRIDPLATRIERSLDTLVADVSSLTGRLDARVEPVTVAATDALDEFGGAMRAVSEFVGDGSSARLELSLLLTEATRTAQSLRSLADYLERHPEALLQGKR
jgi:paraquat-inducible protein B